MILNKMAQEKLEQTVGKEALKTIVEVLNSPFGYTNLGNAVTFDGTNELRLEITFEVF